MNPELAVKTLSDIFGVEISLELATEALAELDTYEDLEYGTLRGKYKLNPSSTVISILAIENTKMNNGDFAKYVSKIKSEYSAVIFIEVINDRLVGWLRRNGFNQTKKNKRNYIFKARLK